MNVLFCCETVAANTDGYDLACFEYTPGIVKRIVHPEDNESDALRVRHDSYVRNGRVIIGYAEGICNNATSIRVNGEKVSWWCMCACKQ